MADLPDDIVRINALTTNARNTWFILLGVLVFVGITLMGVEHIDFYGVDRATKLPLIDLEVPTRSFFLAAPILTAAIYGYFHLYLIRLWDALGSADARYNNRPLGDVISPWLISDAALQLRRWQRKDYCTTSRALEVSAMILNCTLSWGFGIVVLLFLWIASMAARSLFLTGIAGASLLISVFVAVASLTMCFNRLANARLSPVNFWSTAPALITMLVLTPAVPLLSYQKTRGSMDTITKLDLSGENIVGRPTSWTPYRVSRSDYASKWCNREPIKCSSQGRFGPEFEDEFLEWRSSFLLTVTVPDWTHFLGGVSGGQEIEQAYFGGTFAPKLNLKSIHFDNVDFSGAVLEGANFSNQKTTNSDFSNAQMQNLNFSNSEIHSSALRNADAAFSFFNKTKFIDTNISDSNFEGAVFRSANLDRLARTSDVNFSNADMSFIKFRNRFVDLSKFSNTNFTNAYLEGTEFSVSLFFGEPSNKERMFASTSLDRTGFEASAFRNVDFSSIGFRDPPDLRNSFLDGSVIIPEVLRQDMGDPCQWHENVLSDIEFFAHWRGWLEVNGFGTFWQNIAPIEYQDVTPHAPPERCRWKTGPPPGSRHGPLPLRLTGPPAMMSEQR